MDTDRPPAVGPRPSPLARSASPDDLREAWLRERAESAAAFRRWREAGGADRARAYAVYRAAEDRQAAAGATYLRARLHLAA